MHKKRSGDPANSGTRDLLHVEAGFVKDVTNHFIPPPAGPNGGGGGHPQMAATSGHEPQLDAAPKKHFPPKIITRGPRRRRTFQAA